MNPLSAVTWSWRALRGHSVTFAGLFACGVLGISVMTTFRAVLRRLDAPWQAWLLLPMAVVALLAKKETEWWPDPEVRKAWARRIFFGSIVAAILLAIMRPEPPPDPAAPGPRRSEWRK